jgi:inositol transport system ATP-binding protein
MDHVLRVEKISKAFSGVTALDSVSLTVRKGEVHVLMGENGAGKSTLMKIVSGILPKDAGTIYLNGTSVEIRNPKEALRLGISMIHQELNPVRAMSVSENLYLGKELCYRVMGVVNKREEGARTKFLFREMDISIDPDVNVGELSIAEMQMVEIAKALSYDSQIIIMDEPTSAISGREVAKLFEMIRKLTSRGIAIIYISHKMEEIFQIADRITVLRDGAYIETRPAAEFDRDTLVRLMVGRAIGELFPKAAAAKGPVALEVEGLTLEGKFRDISFSVRKGEVLGFSGLMGAGRSEIVETIFGLRQATSGAIRVHGCSVRITSPADAIRHRIALITEDRHRTGLNLKGSVKENITLVSLKKFTRFNQVVEQAKEKCAVDEEMQKLRIKARHRDQCVNTLSGGNQQKVILAKWLLNDPEIIILDEPTRGIDIGAKAEIYRIMSRLTEAGKAIILVSSELQEVLGMCDRVIVLSHGRVTGEFERPEFDPEKIMNAAMGT